MVHLLKLKKEISQDKTKAYMQSADIGHFSRMAHPKGRLGSGEHDRIFPPLRGLCDGKTGQRTEIHLHDQRSQYGTAAGGYCQTIYEGTALGEKEKAVRRK